MLCIYMWRVEGGGLIPIVFSVSSISLLRARLQKHSYFIRIGIIIFDIRVYVGTQILLYQIHIEIHICICTKNVKI